MNKAFEALRVLADHALKEFEAEIETFDILFRTRDFESLSADFLEREKRRLLKLKKHSKILKEYLGGCE